MAAGRPRAFDKEKALEAAMLVFWRNGYAGTSMADLTDAMGINKPSLYAAFGNKEQLFVAAVEQYMRLISPSLDYLYAPDLPLPLRRAWLAFLAPHEARHPKHTMVDASYMAWARRRGYRVNAWTVNDPDEMHRLIGLGVDGIVTDVPDVLRGVLASPSPSQG